MDPSLADSESVAESIDQGDTRFQEELESCPPSHVQDTVAELCQWDSFQPRLPIKTPAPVISTPVVRPVIEPSWKPPVSGPNKGRRVGRNDPCPCGSGKKFKKCCLPTAGN